MKNNKKNAKLSSQAVVALKTIMKKYMEDGTVLVHMSLTENHSTLTHVMSWF